MVLNLFLIISILTIITSMVLSYLTITYEWELSDMSIKEIAANLKKLSPKYRARIKLKMASDVLVAKYISINKKKRKSEKDMNALQNIKDTLALISNFSNLSRHNSHFIPKRRQTTENNKFEVGKTYVNLSERAGQTLSVKYTTVYIPKEITILSYAGSFYRAVDDKGDEQTVYDDNRNSYMEKQDHPVCYIEGSAEVLHE